MKPLLIVAYLSLKPSNSLLTKKGMRRSQTFFPFPFLSKVILVAGVSCETFLPSQAGHYLLVNQLDVCCAVR